MKPKISALAAFAITALFTFCAAAAQRWSTLPPLPPMPTLEQSGYAPVNGIKMYYAIYGQGRSSPSHPRRAGEFGLLGQPGHGAFEDP